MLLLLKFTAIELLSFLHCKHFNPQNQILGYLYVCLNNTLCLSFRLLLSITRAKLFALLNFSFSIGGVSTTAAPIQLQYLLLVAILCSVIFFVVGTLLGVCTNWKKQHCIRCITALRSQQSNPSEEVVYDDIKTLNAEVTGNRLSGRGLSMSENVSYIEH